MARAHRLSIRQKPGALQAVPIQYDDEVVGPETPYAFIYRGIRVLCMPVRKWGRVVTLNFGCPRCGTRQVFDAGAVCIEVKRNGLVHAHGIVRCIGVTCMLTIRLIEGIAYDLTPWVE